jgi:dipeptidyl aminopeptidase/acylaminoacyl peptidase
VANADGSQPLQLTDLRHQLSELGHWSPAGDRIAFVSQDRGSRQIYWVGSSGGPAIPLTKEEGVGVGSGWTRDAKGYYFDSVRSGRCEVRRVPRDGGRSELMTVGEGGFESERGIFYYWRQTNDSTVLMRRTPNGDEDVALVPKGCSSCGTAPAAGGFYYVAADRSEVYLCNEKTGRSVRVLKPPAIPFHQFTISADGRWFAYGFAGTPSIDLMIMEDFR